MEIWKPVLGYEGLYEASNLGRVRSIKYPITRILKPHYKKRGYAHLGLYTHAGKLCCVQLHKAVYEAFQGPIPEGKEIDHIDNDPSNNLLTNLQVLSHKQNMRKAHARLLERGFTNGRAAQTHCKHGHELSGENVYLRGKRRVCRVCVAARYQQRKTITRASA